MVDGKEIAAAEIAGAVVTALQVGIGIRAIQGDHRAISLFPVVPLYEGAMLSALVGSGAQVAIVVNALAWGAATWGLTRMYGGERRLEWLAKSALLMVGLLCVLATILGWSRPERPASTANWPGEIGKLCVGVGLVAAGLQSDKKNEGR